MLCHSSSYNSNNNNNNKQQQQQQQTTIMATATTKTISSVQNQGLDFQFVTGIDSLKNECRPIIYQILTLKHRH